jgi:hypothetical protein
MFLLLLAVADLPEMMVVQAVLEDFVFKPVVLLLLAHTQ